MTVSLPPSWGDGVMKGHVSTNVRDFAERKNIAMPGVAKKSARNETCPFITPSPAHRLRAAKLVSQRPSEPMDSILAAHGLRVAKLVFREAMRGATSILGICCRPAMIWVVP